MQWHDLGIPTLEDAQMLSPTIVKASGEKHAS
jgi:hypothetical protein